MVVLFVAAAFGAMAVLSLPVTRLVPPSIRPLFPWVGPIERLLRPPVPAERAHGPRPAQHEQGPGPAGSPPGPSGPPSGPAPVPAPGPGRPGPPAPEPRPRPEGPSLRDTISRRDRQTIRELSRLMEQLGADRVESSLLQVTDDPVAVANLLGLISGGDLDELFPEVTGAELHRLLADLRAAFPSRLEHAAEHGRRCEHPGEGSPRIGAPNEPGQKAHAPVAAKPKPSDDHGKGKGKGGGKGEGRGRGHHKS